MTCNIYYALTYDFIEDVVLCVEAVSGLCPASIWFGARCSSVVRAFAHGAMGRWIDPSWGGPIELFLIPASAPKAAVCAILCVGWCIKNVFVRITFSF